MEKIPATVTILTRNSGRTLARALEGVRDFEDILICDGGSTDNTRTIAESYGARVIGQDKKYLDEHGKIYDFAGLHNQMLDAAKYNWIFSLDSDEQAGEDLVDAMRKVIEKRGKEGVGVFWVSRKYVLNGTIIDCASTYPNRQMRFFSKNSVYGYVKRIHERLKLKEDVMPEFIGGYMYLPTEDDIEAVRRKWDYQISVAVEQAAPMSIRKYIEAVGHCAKVSLLWFARLLHNAIFCRGAKMPFSFEMERHYFHLRLLRAYWRVVKF